MSLEHFWCWFLSRSKTYSGSKKSYMMRRGYRIWECISCSKTHAFFSLLLHHTFSVFSLSTLHKHSFEPLFRPSPATHVRNKCLQGSTSVMPESFKVKWKFPLQTSFTLLLLAPLASNSCRVITCYFAHRFRSLWALGSIASLSLSLFFNNNWECQPENSNLLLPVPSSWSNSCVVISPCSFVWIPGSERLLEASSPNLVGWRQ